MDFSDTLFRCHSIGHLMTEPQSKAARERGDLSETALTHLIDIYVSRKYGRKTDVSSKYIEKGLAVEEDSITLFCLVKGRFFKKNEETLKNRFLIGTPDLFEGESITKADHIIDVKSSWDIFTFFRNFTKDMNKMYYWQLMAYMDLSSSKSASLAYCLVNTPESLIQDEERKLLYKMNAGTTENPYYMEACEELRKLSIYDDIPIKERMIQFTIERNESDIQRMHDKIEKARLYLNELSDIISPTKQLLT
ncbi:hypothetical protein AB6805_30485 [Chitinophaga sp. RCC_12]|uniref:hypothetical protein n=1 Tax=Chitinophaga sp. RCC_12 TaxID=3239226 RepID=UPI003524970F